MGDLSSAFRAALLWAAALCVAHAGCGDGRRSAPRAGAEVASASAGTGQDAGAPDAAADAAQVGAAVPAAVDAAAAPAALTQQMPTLVFLTGMTLVDFRRVIPNRARVIEETRAIVGPLSRRPAGERQLWLWPSPILESFVGNVDDQQTLFDAMYDASKSATASIVVDEDAPSGPVTLMESLGFEVLVAPVRLRTSIGEVDVYELADRNREKTELVIQKPPP